MFAEDSDDSDWQQDWDTEGGAEAGDARDDDAMLVDLTQEDEVRLQRIVGLLS